MIENSFTREQAVLACKDYQHLKGVEFDESSFVRELAVAPLDPLNKWIFNNYYAESGDAVRALEFYHGPFYDVMVISTEKMKYCDLRTFLRQRNIKFDPAKY